MPGSEFDELEFFRAISGVRYLLMGRRALIVLGLPAMTADYDLWVEFDDAERLNAAALAFDLVPNKTPEQARQTGRYVLENAERVDVLLSRGRTTVDGTALAFADVYSRRTEIELGPDVLVCVPSLDDLIQTKRFAARPKDVEDVRMLEALRARKGAREP